MILALMLSGGLFLLTMCVALFKRDNSLVDMIWGPAVALTGLGLLLSRDVNDFYLLIWAAVCLWALRLGFHIATRHNGEDARYAEWRKVWGGLWAVRSVTQVFFLQWLLSLVVASPLIALAYYPGEGNALAGPLLVVALFGFILEVVADYQLQRFVIQKSQEGHKGPRYLTTGVWSMVRHPNYLGEAIFWLFVGLSCLAAGTVWYAMVGPLLVFVLVRFVSGVPIKERRASGSEWEKYKTQTPKFLPFGRNL